MKIWAVLPLTSSFTLTTVYGHLENVGSLDMNRHVCIKTYLYILQEISGHHLQLKCMGSQLFSMPSLHREYYIVLSDINIV